ncbi:hypothetical protein AAE478_008412 [Parahypoxylon ruwenzoriense]
MSVNWVPDVKEALPEQPTTPPISEPPKSPESPKEFPGGWGAPIAYDYSESDVNREWGSNAKVYEWDGVMGDVGPEIPELEEQLFGPVEKREGAGLDFSAIAEIDVVQEGVTRIKPVWKFEDAGLHPIMLKNVQMAGYKEPTPIQKYSLPAIKMGYDLIAIAQTGSGKTGSYMIPTLNHLMGKAKILAAPRPVAKEIDDGTSPPVRAEPLVVIICPARELAIQIFNEARKFCYRTMLRPCVVYGGGPIQEQLKQLQKGCDVLIGSPGRIVDMMERQVLSFRRVQYMVIDEADELLEKDWEDEFEKILSGGDQEEGNVKYMLFSATFPGPVRKLAKTHLAESHIRIRVGRIGSTHANIKQDVVFVNQNMKKKALSDLLMAAPAGRTIVFVNSKRMADELDAYLFQRKFPSTSMHADRTQREREDAMRAFRSGNAPVLVTTGLTARGIDVRNVKHVVNYDLPSVDYGGIKEYIHRIGRTGRIGYTGLATSFYSDRDEPIAEQLVMTLLETRQKVPDFLQQYVPQGVDLDNFKIEDDNSEDDVAEDKQGGTDNGAGGDVWGADTNPAPVSGGDGWGSGTQVGAADAQGAGGNAGDGWGAGVTIDLNPIEW